MKISFVGIGMGNPNTMTVGGSTALQQADLIIGSQRILDDLSGVFTPNRQAAVKPEEIVAIINGCSFDVRDVCVAFSGDIGFYSGAKRLLDAMPNTEVALIPGISSPQYFASCLGTGWQNWHMVSAHGVAADVVAEVVNHEITFFLTGGTKAEELCQALSAAGLGRARVAVGEHLSYREENITFGTASELMHKQFDDLAVMLVRRPDMEPPRSGIADGEFARCEKPLIPMTKAEVRAAIVAKLQLKSEDVVFDIGAGTGSVSVQMAMAARRGRVYAIERMPEACGLIAQNRMKFGVYNLEVVQGVAPMALVDLPNPDAVFIGGSRGRLDDILPVLLNSNGKVRLCISAVTIESLAHALQSVKNYKLNNIDVTQIQASHSRPAGEKTMMTAENPVWLITAGGQ